MRVSDEERSRKEMEEMVARSKKERSLIYLIVQAAIMSAALVATYFISCFVLLVLTIGAVQGAQYLCLKTHICRA